ncbi:hypothetical protein HGM15179_010388 [Zosterops borbonicus]|uniref:Rna-directed dna polymerase from mobile element jockey-like n=1 Tax=Zosterops borbonicus TaxID=364589 RepID=A0A8K1GDJ1_9PASS|nr:hypothetical protein HGM15179_010388 [Zosterops borbonicus]
MRSLSWRYHEKGLSGKILRRCPNWTPVTDVIPEGLALGLALFDIFVSGMDSGIQCTLRKYAIDTKLCGAVDTLKGRDAIQRGQVRVERFALAILMMFSEAKCKVLHLGQSNPKNKYRLGREWIEAGLGRKAWESCWFSRSST